MNITDITLEHRLKMSKSSITVKNAVEMIQNDIKEMTEWYLLIVVEEN